MANIYNENDKGYKVTSRVYKRLKEEYSKITTGKCILQDKDGNIYHVEKNSEKYLSGELFGFTKGQVPVRDPETGKCFNIKKTDERWINGELKSSTSGYIPTQETKNK
jgi:hypothetical protein